MNGQRGHWMVGQGKYCGLNSVPHTNLIGWNSNSQIPSMCSRRIEGFTGCCVGH